MQYQLPRRCTFRKHRDCCDCQRKNAHTCGYYHPVEDPNSGTRLNWPETERVKERKRGRVERGARDVPMEPGNRADEQVAVRHADASGCDMRENQHEEDRMRDIHVGKRGSEAAGEEQPDMLRKTVRFEQEAPSSSAAASSDPTVALENPASGETQDRPGSVLVQKSGRVDDDVQISALDAFYEKDERKSRCIGEVLEWYRGEDAGDLKRSELNESVESTTCFNALEQGNREK